MQIVLFFLAKRSQPVGSFMTHILRLIVNLFSGFSHVSQGASQSARPALKSYFIFKSAVFPKCRCLMGWLPVSCFVGRDGAVGYGVRTN